MGRIALWDTDSMRHLAKMYGHTDRVLVHIVIPLIAIGEPGTF